MVQALQIFCSEDLGAFYLDILRIGFTRAKPTAMPAARRRPRWHITQTLVRLMAPVLSFTAEEGVELAERTGRRRKRDAHFPRAARAARRGRPERALGDHPRRPGRCASGHRRPSYRGQVGSSLQATLTLAMTEDKRRARLRSAATSNFVLMTSSADLTLVAAAADEGILATASETCQVWNVAGTTHRTWAPMRNTRRSARDAAAISSTKARTASMPDRSNRSEACR